MNIERLLNLDYREEENRNEIHDVLTKIKPLAKYKNSEIPLKDLEKFVEVMSIKYDMYPKEIALSIHDSMICTIRIIRRSDFKVLGSVYGASLYEVFAKLSLKMFYLIKTKKVGLSELTEIEKKRKKVMRERGIK